MSNKILLDKLNNEKSLYAVSHATGIPYTTISKLSRGLLDINKCSGDVIYSLSLYFRCSMEDLLNPVQMMTGISGTYRKIKYYWKQENDKTALYITDNEKEKKIDEGNYSQKRFYDMYPLLAENMIDLYISDKETEKLLYD